LKKREKLHQIANSDESGALEGICIDGQCSVDAGQIRFVKSGGVQMISSILGLQLVTHARALLNAAIQGSLYSTMASVGLLGQMNRSQRFVAYLGRSTNGATHGIGRISAILGVLVIIMAGLSIDMRAKRHQKLRSDLRNVEEKYVEYYRDLSNQAISLRDGFGNVDGATTPITFVTFKTCHGTYFRAHPGGEGATIDLQTAIGPWEKFTME